MRRWRARLEPLEHLRQLPLEELEFGNLLLDTPHSPYKKSKS
jgi:hypothetical protein